MYCIKNGILYKNGKKEFVLGESYYPSFHPSKFPVPPEGDRYGEMKKDLRMMREAGFNHVRFAALGNVSLGEDGEVCVDTPFIDDMIEEAEKNDISVSIRQQGFSVNLRGFTDAEMVDYNGRNPDFIWSDFVRTTLNHEGILEDNQAYAEALAEHYSKNPTVVAFQIYNEPHYPEIGTPYYYDYHPKTIEAFRRWLVENGVFTNEEAENYEPPRTRGEQSSRMWALWRIFSMDNLNAFLENAAIGSKKGSPLPTFTCLTSYQVKSQNYSSGVDYFGNARALDILGYTTYIHANGPGYYPMCLHADLAQCAAELEGKESWCVELDSRTYIPCTVYNRGTFVIIGAGAKGIVYYQWRGDCPVPGVPYPNSCGILNYDGTKTHNFDNAVNVNRYVERMNDLIMNSRREHMGIGLLHSEYATLVCDSREEKGTFQAGQKGNIYLTVYTEVYRQLRDAGYNVSITDAANLKKNPFGIKVLFVPRVEMLSDEERKAVDEARASGVRVFENMFTEGTTRCIAFKEYRVNTPTGTALVFDPYHSVYDIEEMTGVHPVAISLDNGVGIQVLRGDGYRLLVLTNKSSVRQEINAKIRINTPFISAEIFDIDGEKDVVIKGNEVSVDIKDGGIILLR